ncbi:hypothetical protein PDG61_21185 [Mycolicibacterium sp. BiH015]|uniref:hypothetical protein n=1 Tax=Mycolicibacterium sp. BiH015 TaxID=3018808 RepID=UPI0022E80814|nr:hypothetical protein [Mycolicibacterium sp. BiH015]MDA2893443.1 hypothetical protein [Mycolicibacterium sp. BiH015]
MSGMRGSETRQLTKGVFVRFTHAQLELLQEAATQEGVSLPQLLRDRVLSPVMERAAS